MQRNRVFFVLIALLASMVLVLAGCGGDDGEEEAAAGPAQESYVNNPYTNGEDLSGTTVNIFGAFVDTDAERFNASMVSFEEETGIDIQYEGSGDFESLITVRVEGGDPPDIAAFPQPGLMQDLAERGHIMDLMNFMEMDYLQQQYDQSWLDLASHEGIMAGVWYRASVKSLVWYPVPEFSEAGYEIPETWAEMLELSQQMVDDGNTPWSIAIESSGATGWVATDWLEDIMLRIHPPEVYDRWVVGELGFDSPEVREAMGVMEPNRLDGFVAGDISPRDYPPAHEKLIEALNGIDLDEIGERKQADLKLSERIPNPVIRSFLLKNLKRKDSRYTWRIDLESLERSMEPLSSWPEELKTKKYQGPALFLRGERSDYIKSDDISGIRKIFPNAQIKTVEDAGHWIHFDNRDTFTDMLSDFLHQVHK